MEKYQQDHTSDTVNGELKEGYSLIDIFGQTDLLENAEE